MTVGVSLFSVLKLQETNKYFNYVYLSSPPKKMIYDFLILFIDTLERLNKCSLSLNTFNNNPKIYNNIIHF